MDCDTEHGSYDYLHTFSCGHGVTVLRGTGTLSGNGLWFPTQGEDPDPVDPRTIVTDVLLGLRERVEVGPTESSTRGTEGHPGRLEDRVKSSAGPRPSSEGGDANGRET